MLIQSTMKSFLMTEFHVFSVGITGGQEDFFTMNPHLLNGIDVSQVQDIDRVDAIDLPTVTDSSGKPLFTGLYSGPYFDLRTMAKNQTVQIGENALIHCAVKQVGEKSVNLRILWKRWYQLKSFLAAGHRPRQL